MTTPAFYTARHELTPYALGCGYVEQTERAGVQTTLWAEGGAYHVRQHDFDRHERVFWDVFDTLTEARRRYREASR